MKRRTRYIGCMLSPNTGSQQEQVYFFAEQVTAVSAAFCWIPKHCKPILRQEYCVFMEASCPVLCPQRILSNLLLRSYWCCLPSSFFFSFNTNVHAQLLSLPSCSTDHFRFHLFLFFLCFSVYLLPFPSAPTLYCLSCPEKYFLKITLFSFSIWCFFF